MLLTNGTKKTTEGKFEYFSISKIFRFKNYLYTLVRIVRNHLRKFEPKILTKLHRKMEKCCCVVFHAFSFLLLLLCIGLCENVFAFVFKLQFSLGMNISTRPNKKKLPFQLAMQIVLSAPQFHLVWIPPCLCLLPFISSLKQAHLRVSKERDRERKDTEEFFSNFLLQISTTIRRRYKKTRQIVNSCYNCVF